MNSTSTIRRYGSRAVRATQRTAQARILGPLRSSARPGAVGMFHIGRCGSTVLCDLLDQHPRISSDGEPYNRAAKELDRRGIDPETSGLDPANHVADRFGRVGARWYLYSLKFNQVTQFGTPLERYLPEMSERGLTHLVVLDRSNLLRKVVSGLMARSSGTFQSSDPNAVARRTVRIDIDAVPMEGETHTLLGQFDRWLGEYAEFDRVIGDRSVLRLNYERDIEADPRVAYRKVIDHLGLDPHPVDVRLQKLNPYPLADIIENHDEVASALRGTPHTWMLD